MESSVFKPSLNDEMKTCFLCVMYRIIVTVVCSCVPMEAWVNGMYLSSVSLHLFFEIVFLTEPEAHSLV